MTTVTRRLAIAIQRLKDGQTARSLDRSGALSRRGFKYLPTCSSLHSSDKKPDLTVFWVKEPDATNHAYGPGRTTRSMQRSMNDEILWAESRQDPPARLERALTSSSLQTQSQHGVRRYHPLPVARKLSMAAVGSMIPMDTRSLAFVRTAELLTRDG